MSEVAPHPKITAEDRLPGDLTKDELVERMIRVDHAGEYGAVRIYAGQRAVLRHGAAARAIDGPCGGLLIYDATPSRY